MKKSIVALLTGCAQNNATSTEVATLADEATYNYVFGSGNYEPRDADALGTAVAKYVENTKGEIIKVSGDIWYDEGH